MPEQDRVVYNGRYELHHRIGRGGMADVFLARDQLLERPVAIKVLFPEFAGDPSFVERFRREAQAAANLNHPNIVSVYDWGKVSGTYYIVMEYVDGRTVSDIIRTEGPLHPNRAADIAADVAAALASAHRSGVVHRDIKPGNILVTASGQVKVADFGIARAISAGVEENLTQAGSVMGTATYFSPEQAQGHALDPRSDLYSLGVVMYEMVSGKPPFSGESPVAIAYQHVQRPIPPLHEAVPGIPTGYEAITQKLLAKNPANRYASGEDLRADLRRFREGKPLAAEPVLVPPTADDPATLVGAAAVGAAGGAALVGSQAGRPSASTYIPPQPTPVEHIPPRRGGWFFVVLILLLVALGGLLFLFAQVLGINKDALTTVPLVRGRPQAEALTALQTAKLKASVVNVVSDQPAGIVVDQDPKPGQRVKENSSVKLQISNGPASGTIPDVTGQSQTDAQAALRNAGFTNIVLKPDTNSTAPDGKVTRTDPPAGQVVAKSQEVDVYFSAGTTTTIYTPPSTTPTTAAPTTAAPTTAAPTTAPPTTPAPTTAPPTTAHTTGGTGTGGTGTGTGTGGTT